MAIARGPLVLGVAALCGALVAGATTAGLTAAGIFTPLPSVAVGPELDQSPLTWQERMDLAREWSSDGPTPDGVEQVRESSLTRQRVEMLGHTYVVELVSSQHLEFPNTAVYRAKKGGAFVDFRFEAAGPDKEAAENALASAAHGDPLLTLFVKSAGRTTSVDHRIGATGDSRGAHPQVQVVWPGPFAVPDLRDAKYWFVVEGERHDVTP